MAFLYVDPKYNPNFVGNITSKTKLAPGISVGKFTGAPGSRTRIESFPSQDRPQILRNLYMHAEAMRVINENQSQFKDVSVVVSEGLYKGFVAGGDGLFPLSTNPSFRSHVSGIRVNEQFPSTDNDANGLPHIAKAKQFGKAIVYEVIGRNGKVDIEKTFEVAEFWKDNIQYDWIILEYDHFDPNGSLHAQISLVMPNIPYTFDTMFKKDIATMYNYHLQANHELVEMREKYNIIDPVLHTGLSEVVSELGQNVPDPTVEQTKLLGRQSSIIDRTLNDSFVGAFNDSRERARTVVESYIGRQITDREFNALIRAVHAEASINAEEQAYVAGVILNRARTGYSGSYNIVDTLLQQNQFQSVTGTPANGRNPSSNFTNGPGKGTGALRNIYNNIETYLNSTNTSWMNFTAANASAYGPGTDIGFLDRMIASGGRRIGDTVFGTV